MILSDDANQLGPLDSFSTFPFENYLHSLKKMLRKCEKPLSQIHRRIVEKNTANEYKQCKNVIKYSILVAQKKKKISSLVILIFSNHWNSVILNYPVLHQQILLVF